MATLHNASTRTYMQQNHKSAASSSVSPGRWTSQWPHDGRTGVDTGRQQTAATGEVRKTCQQQPAWGRDDHVDGVEGGNNGTGARAQGSAAACQQLHLPPARASRPRAHHVHEGGGEKILS